MENLWSTEDLMGVTGAPSEYIGKRFCYSRKESKNGVPYEWLVRVLSDLGLSKFAPQSPSPADAFRRACEDIPKGYVKEDGKKYKIAMVAIDEAANPILRNLQVTEVDKAEKTSTEGRLVAQIEFDRETERFDVRYGYSAGKEFISCPDFVQERIWAAQNSYRKEVNLVSDQQINGLVRKILESAGNPIQDIASTWNIPATRQDTLNKLIELAGRMNDEVEDKLFNVDSLPVVNTKETRKKVSADAVAYALDKLNKVLENEKDNIVFATDPEKQKTKSALKFQNEATGVMSLIEEYEILIGEAMDEVRQAREITENNLKKFCADPTKQAEHKTHIEEKRSGRKLKKSTAAEAAENTSETESDTAPIRKFNMGAQQSTQISA
jgi:hypothetical protein